MLLDNFDDATNNDDGDYDDNLCNGGDGDGGTFVYNVVFIYN